MRNEIPNKYFCDCKYPIAIVFKSLILESMAIIEYQEFYLTDLCMLKLFDGMLQKTQNL